MKSKKKVVWTKIVSKKKIQTKTAEKDTHTMNTFIYVKTTHSICLVFGLPSKLVFFLFICRFFHPLLLALHTCLPILSIYVQHFSFIFYSCLSLKRCKCHFSFVFFFCIFPIFWNENDKMLLHILAFGERVLNREFG